LKKIFFEKEELDARAFVVTRAKDNTVAVPIYTDKLLDDAYSP